MSRATAVLLSKGYMELEETLMQWKQHSHLIRMLQVSMKHVEYTLHVMHVLAPRTEERES